MIKIKIEKKDNKEIYEEPYGIQYISKEDFISINDKTSTLKYIRLMKKIRYINKEKFLKNIYKILFELSIENIDVNHMKIFVNNYYKYVKLYKKHMLSFKEDNKNIIDFYVKLFETNNNLDINSVRYIFHLLYNEKILKSEYILEWYHNLSEDSKFKKIEILEQFIEWLKDQSSESEVSEIESE